MSEFIHWCGNCQIRIYIERHYGKRLNYQICPYVCEYKTEMTKMDNDKNEKSKEDPSHPIADSVMMGEQ